MVDLIAPPSTSMIYIARRRAGVLDVVYAHVTIFNEFQPVSARSGVRQKGYST
jgi:hypothetical protein